MKGIVRIVIKIDNVWKIRYSQKLLRSRALTLYINNSLNVLHREELIQLFNEEFTTPGELFLSNFSDVRFKTGEDVSEYYQQNVCAERALGLDTNLLLEAFAEGLPRELKQLMIDNSSKSTTEWRELVHRLNKFKIMDNF